MSAAEKAGVRQVLYGFAERCWLFPDMSTVEVKVDTSWDGWSGVTVELHPLHERDEAYDFIAKSLYAEVLAEDVAGAWLEGQVRHAGWPVRVRVKYQPVEVAVSAQRTPEAPLVAEGAGQ